VVVKRPAVWGREKYCAGSSVLFLYVTKTLTGNFTAIDNVFIPPTK
jgi:hypothetical protein